MTTTENPPRRARPGLLSWGLLAGFVAASVFAASAFEGHVRRQAVDRVARLGEKMERSFRERIDHDEDLVGTAALLVFRGKDAGGVAAAVDGFLEHARRPGVHAEMTALRFVAPDDVRGSTPGEEVPETALTAAARARDAGVTTLAPPSAASRPGAILLVVPSFEPGLRTSTLEERREAFRGAIVATLSVAKLVDAAALEQEGSVGAELFAGAGPVPALLLWKGGAEATDARHAPETVTRAFRMSGQDFLFRLHRHRDQEPIREDLLAGAILLVGLALGGLSFSLVRSRQRTRDDALRMAAETTRALAGALEKNRVLLGSSPLGVIEWDAGFRARALNPVAERIFGCKSAAAVGRPGSEFFADAAEADRLWRDMRHSERGRSSCEARTAGAAKIVCDWTFAPLLDAEGRLSGAVSVIEDVSSRLGADEEARQSQKMEAIGRLAGGVAHDFNNILTAILGYADLLELRLAAEPKAVAPVREIRRAAERAAALTRQLLAFGRRQVLKVQRLDLNASVQQAAALLSRLLGETVQLKLELHGELWPVQADPGQVEQVIVNLAVNARDAMPDGGTIVVRTSNLEVPAERRSGPGLAPIPPGAWVLLSVSDTGEGMDEQVRAKIFEPFFTTKSRGRGTGLGLATVYGIVRQSGGHILVRSAPGEGATFDVYLPRTFDPGKMTSSGGTPRLNTEGSETILLVEDEDSVRGLARHILVESGYTVLDAPDAEQALLVAETHEAKIHLLLTDVVLPHTSGVELAARLAGKRPGVRVLYVSGYPDDALGRHGIVGSEVAFLQKPFTPLSLRQRVREVLDARGTE